MTKPIFLKCKVAPLRGPRLGEEKLKLPPNPALNPDRFYFLWECEICAALVEEPAREKHEAWHRGERR